MSEEQRIPGSIREAMEHTPSAFRPEKAGGVTAVIQYRFTGDEAANWIVRIAEGKCTVEEGEVGQATLTIDSPSDVWLKILRREMDGTMAFMTGKCKFQGDMGVLMQMQGWFGR